MKARDNEPRILVPAESFIATYDGLERTFIQGETRVQEGDPMIAGLEHLFKPIEVTPWVTQ